MFFFIIPFGSLSCFFLFLYFKKYPIPIFLRNLAFHSVYGMIHLFSKMQMVVNKIILLLNPINQTCFHLLNILKREKDLVGIECIDFIFQGKEIYHCSKQEMEFKKSMFPEKFDFILFTKKDEKGIFHKKIIYHYPLEENDLKIEKTDYIFLLIELKLHSSIFKLDFQNKTNKTNFYVVGNKFNATFLYYFLKKYDYIPNHNSMDFKQFLENFLLNVIDNSINRHEIFYLDEILLKKKNYEITEIFQHTFQHKITDSLIQKPSDGIK